MEDSSERNKSPDRVEYSDEESSITYFEGDQEVGRLKLAFTDTNGAVIVDVGVDKEFQGKGIATKLTKEAVRIAREKGINKMGAIAQPDYLRILKKQGFAQDGFFATKKLRAKE